MLKCNIEYILNCGDAILRYNFEKITLQKLSKNIGEIIEAGDRFFSFKPILVMRTFLIAVKKFDEIEQKIELRKNFMQKAK